MRCWEPIREILHAHYEIPMWYEEPRLSQLEDVLEEALTVILERLRDSVTLIPAEAGTDIGAWRATLQEVAGGPGACHFR